VAADANDSAMKAHHAELQSALERVRDFAEAHVGAVGTAEFPVLEHGRLWREMRHPETRGL